MATPSINADRRESSSQFDCGSRLHIVIVNYRSASLAIQCLQSLEPEIAAIARCCVTVVENASGEASELAAAIEDRGWSGWARLIELDENRGFAAGNNSAIKPLLRLTDRPEYFLLLNPDTVVRSGGLQALLEFMDRTPACGIAGSRLEDPDGTVQRSAFRFPSVLGEFENAARTGPISRLLSRYMVAPPNAADAIQTDWVAGASMMVRREVFCDVGLMDEGFFLYFEEVDFCKRVKNAGWQCWYVPTSRVIHLVGQSSGVTDAGAARRRRPAYWFDSRRRYFLRHSGWARSILADLAWLSGAAIHYARCALSGRQTDLPPKFVTDMITSSVVFHPRQSATGE